MILATRSGDREVRSFQSGGVDSAWWVGGAPNTGSVYGIPAVTACVQFASSAVAVLRMRVWTGDGSTLRRVSGAWQARLLAGAPNDAQTDFGFWETIEESLCYRGNSYVWKMAGPDGRVSQLYALHPDQVSATLVGREPRYTVRVGDGFLDPIGKGRGSYEVPQGSILHIRGFGDGGYLVAPSPITRHRQMFDAAGAQIDYEASFYRRGARPSMVVTLPGQADALQRAAARAQVQEVYGGPQNAGKAIVLGSGETVTPISLTQDDAQYIEARKLSIAEIARVFSVPVSLVTGEQSRTPEQERERWLSFGLRPRLARIEAAFRADPSLFGRGARVFPRFDTNGEVHGDVATETARLVTLVQVGVMTPDDARAELGLDPLPNGQGQIPQLTPVGGSPNKIGPVAGKPDDQAAA
ncbi:MAG: phage portal protein [Actinobacteria bacterium]|nr:phage portal protein [Actinomycetota bacterium]